MASSLYRRLHDVFTKTAKPQILTAIADTKSKSIPTTPNNPSSLTEQQKSLKHQKLRSQINKFKQSTKIPWFRRLFTNYDTFIRRLIKTKQFSAIDEVLQHQKTYPEIQDERFTVRLICLYGKAGMFEHARKLFDEMPHLNCKQSVMSFNALLAAAVNSKKYDKFSEIFRELPEKMNIELDVVSYNTVIKAFCEMGSLNSAISVLDEMGNNGIDPDVVTFNTILVAVYKSNKVSEAENIWSLMENKNVVPNIRSYNARLRCLLENKKVVEAHELIEEMKKKGVMPDTHTYNAMIAVCKEDGNLKLAKSWHAKLEETGCIPDLVTFGLLIPLACDKGDPEYACELCKKCIDLKYNMFTRTFQRVVDMLVGQSMIKEANELVELGQNCSYRYRLTMPEDPQ